MTIVSVVYPKQSGTFFDMDYYIHKHALMVKTLFAPMGLENFQLLHGTDLATGGEPIYEVIALLTFPSADAFRAALEKHGSQILDDIPNFTDMHATIQINDAVEP